MGVSRRCDVWYLIILENEDDRACYCLHVTYFLRQTVSVSVFLALLKDTAALTVPVSSGGKQAGSSTSKPSVTCGRSNSLNSRSGDLTSGGSKVSGSLKRGSLIQPTRPASHPARPAVRICSSRSFSSLHTSSFTAVPFMRSSRSLNRLDQRPTGDGNYIKV